MTDVRQRKPVPSTPAKAEPKKSAAALAKDEDSSSFSLLDIFRVLTFVLIVSSALSYFVTRKSLVWGLERPNWTRVDVINSWIVRLPCSILLAPRTVLTLLPQNGPVGYTDEDLKAYDGTDPEKPLLLAINGTIYDVSNGRKHYGPGGSYHFFAGADASRGFVTGCFDTDRTPDMRGVEEMYLPLDDPEIDGLFVPPSLPFPQDPKLCSRRLMRGCGVGTRAKR